MKVLSISCGRSDVGILTPVWRALSAEAGIDLHVLFTGAHASDDAAGRAALPQGAVGHTAGADMAGAGGAEAGASMAAIVGASSELAACLVPDRALVIGDRLDMMAAALGLVPANIPIIHLHGGELSYGAVDDRLRHAITKLSHLHCAATVDAAMRIAGLGEEPWRISVTGAPGLDSLQAVDEMSVAEFAAAVGLPGRERLRLVTVHPETNCADPLGAARETLEALARVPGPTVITAPNADPGAVEIRSMIEQHVDGRDDTVFHEALGGALYANALRSAAIMVGNSSSGIVEAGLFGLPVINVGGRQDGRQRGSHVMDCAAAADAVADALNALPPRSAPSMLYGDGQAAPRIAAAVTAPHDAGRLLRKTFSEHATAAFQAPWADCGETPKMAMTR